MLQMTDEDLDHLAAASDEDYWRVLNGIVRRIESRSTTVGRRSEEEA